MKATKDIYDIENPDRQLCLISGCANLQRNHGKKVWGKYCDKHHKDPVLRCQRVKARELHREMVKSEIAGRGIERRRNIKIGKIYPMACSKCGHIKSKEGYPSGSGNICNICTNARSRNNALKRQYGIGQGEYEAILTQQGGVCSICGELPSGDKSLSVDHCHTTGDVRGLLCGKCNMGIGLFSDDLDLLASAASYLVNSRLKKVV
jgi:hypothetical protein